MKTLDIYLRIFLPMLLALVYVFLLSVVVIVLDNQVGVIENATLVFGLELNTYSVSKLTVTLKLLFISLMSLSFLVTREVKKELNSVESEDTETKHALVASGILMLIVVSPATLMFLYEIPLTSILISNMREQLGKNAAFELVTAVSFMLTIVFVLIIFWAKNLIRKIFSYTKS